MTKAGKATAAIVSILVAFAAIAAIYIVINYVFLQPPSAPGAVPLLAYLVSASLGITVCIAILHLTLIFIYIALEGPCGHLIDNLAYMFLGALYHVLGVLPYFWLGAALFIGAQAPSGVLEYILSHKISFVAYLTVGIVGVATLHVALNLSSTTEEIAHRFFKTKIIMYILVAPYAAYFVYMRPNPLGSDALIGTIALISMTGVAGWFFISAKGNEKNEILWSVIGAITFYIIVVVCGKALIHASIIPLLLPFMTSFEDIGNVVVGTFAASIAVGICFCAILSRLFLANQRLFRTRYDDTGNNFSVGFAMTWFGVPRELRKETLEKPDWASAIGHDHYGLWTEITVGNVTQKLRWIPPGTFLMGSPQPKDQPTNDEGPQHEVTFADGFWLFDTACTQAMWWAVMGNNPSFFKKPNHPVECVSWNAVQEFLRQLNKKMPGLGLSLPSEAQWEYACRAGTTTPYSFGENVTREHVNHDGDGTVPVASLPANPWGLYEMHGNVWEWCADSGHKNYHGAPNDGSAWLPKKWAWLYENAAAHKTAATRVLRGGSWLSPHVFVTSTSRDALLRNVRDPNYGFRCVRNLP